MTYSLCTQFAARGLLGAVILAMHGCAATPTSDNPPRLAPATTQASSASTIPAVVRFADAKTGLTLDHPADWTRHQSANFVLLLAPPGLDRSEASLSVDVPELPPHIPGLIPIGLVKNGYVDDLKKAHPGIVVSEAIETRIDGAAGRRVESTYQDGGRTRTEVALLMVRGDHVVILRGQHGEATRATVRGVFEAVAESIRWKR